MFIFVSYILMNIHFRLNLHEICPTEICYWNVIFESWKNGLYKLGENITDAAFEKQTPITLSFNWN